MYMDGQREEAGGEEGDVQGVDEDDQSNPL